VTFIPQYVVCGLRSC